MEIFRIRFSSHLDNFKNLVCLRTVFEVCFFVLIQRVNECWWCSSTCLVVLKQFDGKSSNTDSFETTFLQHLQNVSNAMTYITLMKTLKYLHHCYIWNIVTNYISKGTFQSSVKRTTASSGSWSRGEWGQVYQQEPSVVRIHLKHKARRCVWTKSVRISVFCKNVIPFCHYLFVWWSSDVKHSSPTVELSRLFLITSTVFMAPSFYSSPADAPPESVVCDALIDLIVQWILKVIAWTEVKDSWRHWVFTFQTTWIYGPFSFTETFCSCFPRVYVLVLPAY